jgi:phosphosulfolactate synthase
MVLDWRDPGFLDLPELPRKPRATGLTHVLDPGLDTATARAALADRADFIDIWKIGWGTAYIDRALPDKLAMLADHGVRACLGGTLLELAWLQGRAAQLLAWAGRIGCPCVEVSRGTVPMTLTDKQHLIRTAAADFTVYAEVGSKHRDVTAPPADWAAEAAADLAAGAALVIAEGRASGTVGIYDPSGEVRAEIVDALTTATGLGSLLFETPRTAQQAWFIRAFGPEVNLGNIAPDEAISVETLRLGLRSDTMAAAAPVESSC